MTSYPTSIKTWTARVDAVDDIMAADVNTIYDEVTALETNIGLAPRSGNTKSTQGLTLNQGAYDDEILAFKSSDVAHGMTTLVETDTYGTFLKGSATAGGVELIGLSEDTVGINLLGLVTTGDATKSASGVGAVVLESGKKSGTTGGTVGAGNNILAIRDWGSTKFIFDASGVMWLSGDIYTDTWTDYSATSTIVGWSSFTTKILYYKKVGKLVFVSFSFIGTSNSTAASFSLPYSAASPTGITIPVNADDNGAQITKAVGYLGDASTLSFYVDGGGTGWTNSGSKQVRGQFFYQAA